MRRLDLLLTSLLTAFAAQCTAANESDAFAGTWVLDGSANAGAAADAAPPAARPSAAGGRRHGSQSAGAGGSRGGGRGRGDRASASAAGHESTQEDELERGERGLARMFADRVTITPIGQRIRFDDGEHVIELDRDGMNSSGPGIGGTAALSAIEPDIVVDTLTDSGYSLRERYHVADDGRLELHLSLKRPGIDQPREQVRRFDRSAKATGVAAAAQPVR